MRRILVFLALALGLSGSASAQPAAVGKVIVHVRELGGANISGPAWVRLYSDISMFQLASNGQDGSRIIFENVPLGEWHIEVRAPGYLTATNEAALMTPGGVAYAFVDMRLEKGPHTAAAAANTAGAPVMAPKARKELEQAGTALLANDFKKAQEHLDRAKKLAPSHPDVFYLQGLIYFQQQMNTEARASLQSAVNIYPMHASAQASLGAVLFRLGDFTAAVAALDKSVEISPQNWQSHRALAMCHIQLRAYDKARAHVERAIETSGDKFAELHVLLARILIALKQKDKARTELQSFITGNPGHPEIAEAQRLLTLSLGELSAPSAGTPVVAPAPPAENAANTDPVLSTVRMSATLPEVRSGPGRWAPPAVDDTPPMLLKNSACKLPEVLTGTGKRAVALAANLEQVTATEKVEQADLDEGGNQTQVRTSVFRYLVSIIETRPGNLSVEESREAVSRSANPQRFMSNGLGAMALIFHPYYAKDYEMRCEGLTEVNGQPAWSVHFKQRTDVPSRFYQYTLQAGRGSFSIPLKGRAWIAANNFQVLRLETDLVEPVKKLQLEQEHLVIEYQPVDFKTRKVRLWLPASAEKYSFFRGHRFLDHHSFANYQVFSVDVSHKTTEQKNP